MLLAIFSYPSPAQFLQYLGWRRDRTTLRDKAAFESSPCSFDVLTQQKDTSQHLLTILLSKRKAQLCHESCLPAKKILKSAVYCQVY